MESRMRRSTTIGRTFLVPRGRFVTFLPYIQPYLTPTLLYQTAMEGPGDGTRTLPPPPITSLIDNTSLCRIQSPDRVCPSKVSVLSVSALEVWVGRLWARQERPQGMRVGGALVGGMA